MSKTSDNSAAQNFGRVFLLSASLLLAPAMAEAQTANEAAVQQDESAPIQKIKELVQELKSTTEGRLQRVAAAIIADTAAQPGTGPQTRKEAFITLIALLNHYDKNIRDIAVDGIGRAGAVDALYAEKAYNIIDSLTDNSRYTPDVGLMGIGIEHTGKLGAARKNLSERAFEKLDGILQNYKDLSLQAQAIKGIGRIGAAQEDFRQKATNSLQSLIGDKESHSYLRAMARNALEDIKKAAQGNNALPPTPAP